MSSGEEMLQLFRVLYSLIFGFLLVLAVCLVLQLIGAWKTYKKLGLKPWVCLVPVYTTWVLSNRLVKREIAIGATVTAAIVFIVQFLDINLDEQNVTHVLLGILAIITLVYDCIIKDKLSKEFGYGVGFTVGLVLIAPVFWMILGFNDRMPLQRYVPAGLPSGTVGGSAYDERHYADSTQDSSKNGNNTVRDEDNSPFIED